jgi:DNA-binding MarR family transcriptional regulator
MPPKDHVDVIAALWEKEHPDYDLSAVHVIGRMARIMEYVDAALEEKFEEFGISRASFDVMATLRRVGPPYRLSQRELMDSLMRTSGSISVRIDALERANLVRREAASEDRRSVNVTLTEAGFALIEMVAPQHLKNEQELLAALDATQRKTLTGLLRTWLCALEAERGERTVFGIALVPKRVALKRRRAVGLADVNGLMVEETVAGSAAEGVGLRRGDVITAVDGTPVESARALRKALAANARPKRLSIVRGTAEMTLTL